MNEVKTGWEEMQLRPLGATGLHVPPLIVGGNVFGWTADRDTSFAILDACLAAGLNTIDTADVYNRFAPGLQGGESETLIGDWLADRGVRDQVILITKGGLPMGEGMEGLGADYLPRACDASLQRLRTDHIDVYMAHRSDPGVPIADTLATFQRLKEDGRITAAGCSNYSAAELAEALAAGRELGFGYQVFEPHYNLADRPQYEQQYEALCENHQLGVIAYYGLASGFLTGKYRSVEQVADSPRRRVLQHYFTDRGMALLAALDAVATRHGATPAQVALAWLMARPSVTAPIASVTSVAQLHELLPAMALPLSAQDLAQLENI